MNIKPEQVILVLIIGFVLWCVYKNYATEGFCPGPDCQVVHNWPYIKQWDGRDDQRKWGQNWFKDNGSSFHPSVPSITNYDNRPFAYTEDQLAGFGCPAKEKQAFPAIQPTPFVPPAPLCLNCPNPGPACTNRSTQLADLPLPGNHEDVNFLPSEGAPISEIGASSIPVGNMTIPPNNGGNGNAVLDQVPPTGVVEELTETAPIQQPVQLPQQNNNNVLVQIKSAVSMKVIIAIIIGLGLFWYFCRKQ